MQQMVREAYVVFDRSSENVPWSRHQQCLSDGNVRCCDHLSDAFSKQAKSCTHVPGLARMDIYDGVYRRGERDAAIT